MKTDRHIVSKIQFKPQTQTLSTVVHKLAQQVNEPSVKVTEPDVYVVFL